VIRIYARIDDRDDAGTADVKSVLCIRQADDLRGRLRRVSVPDDCAVVIHRSRIGETVGRVPQRRGGQSKATVRFYAYDAKQRPNQIYGSGQKVGEQVPI